ncbi:MAG TPA: sulfur carrier protein ThiS [Blastocatellia bacterium]|nr:sulfur carrier protein ThiS [Blastocatellia bacterium]
MPIPGRTQLTIVINGNQTEIEEGSGISDLIGSLGLDTERVAVELNKKIVRRADWASTMISEGDKVEIVHFVGGGEGKTL